MTNQRVARGRNLAEATRVLPVKRGERLCSAPHDTPAILAGVPCPKCGAVA